jgi:hypothetical protein
MSVAAKVTVAHVIAEYDNEVWLFRGSFAGVESTPVCTASQHESTDTQTKSFNELTAVDVCYHSKDSLIRFSCTPKLSH